MRYYWTDKRHQITYCKQVTHAVKMVDSYSRENSVLCTTKVSGKILNQILLEVSMNCTKHFDLSSSLTLSSLTLSCVARFLVC